MKKVFIFSTFLIVLAALSSKAVAQDLPRIIQPSPEASQLFRFQDYPMDYSTGLPQISIALYEVKSGSLSVPISISYHASGRKVYDQDGPVAVGWSLNAGGSISRTVHGAVDFGTSAGTFKFPYPFTTTGLTNLNNLPYLENAMHFDKNPTVVNTGTWTDDEYDVFSYSFGDHGGKFIFKDNNDVKTPVLLPYKPYIITPTYTTSGSTKTGLTVITILDDKGVLYQFSGMETTLQSQSSIETVPATTGYFLTQIISADKTDTINFQYHAFNQYKSTISQQITWNDNVDGTVVTEGPTETENTSSATYQTYRLTEIDFKQGKVLFNLVGTTDKVDNIQVKNNAGYTVKTIQLNRSTLNNMSELGYSVNKLDGIVLKDSTGAAIENYAFDYYPFVFNDPNQTDHTALNCRYRDYWGYYNASGVSYMIPEDSLEYRNTGITETRAVGYPSANRAPNFLAEESGVLKKITYPTGGTTEFVYETNMYFSTSGQVAKTGPGLRVSQIKNSDNNGTVTYKTYTYGDNESGYGSLDLEPEIWIARDNKFLHDPTTMATESIYNQFTSAALTSYYYRSRIFNSDFLPQLSEVAERPVIYTTVTEYNGTLTDNIGKTVYTYDYSPWDINGMPNLETPALTIIKKHIYNFNYCNPPQMLEQKIYKNVNQAYNLRKDIVNNYTFTTSETVSGLHVQRVHVCPQADMPSGLPPGVSGVYAEPYGVQYANSTINIYTYSDYQIPVGYKNLSSTTETTYNDDGSAVTNTKTYTYNAKQYISQAQANTSDNNYINTITTYPFDYTGNAVLTQMIDPSTNMLNFPVEVSQTKGTTSPVALSSVRTNYYNYGSTVPRIYPQTVDVKKGSNSYETRLRYYGYDGTGNPLSVSKEKDENISYVWDYGNTYPVAEVKNAAVADIAFTSFEADGTGNWSGVNTANLVSDPNSVTGGKYYTLTSSTLSKTLLTTGTHYIVSYWSKNGQYTVSGTPVSGWPKTLRQVTVNGVTWTNYEHNVTGVTSISVSGTGAIDELRLYPDNAQMTSYTYTPLIGATTQADANNRITYYEYDAFGRLKLIRDMDRNILKTFSYQYQGVTY